MSAPSVFKGKQEEKKTANCTCLCVHVLITVKHLADNEEISIVTQVSIAASTSNVRLYITMSR